MFHLLIAKSDECLKLKQSSYDVLMNNQMGRELRYIIFRGTMPIHDKCAIDTRERFINPIQISLRCWPQPPLFELNRRSRNESNHIYISNLPTIESALGLLRKI